MEVKRLILLSSFAIVFSSVIQCYEVRAEDSPIPDEKWGYVTVRPQAHMFWWLYGGANANARQYMPLILWLQGGPGGSGTGFGNFGEIGPLDKNMNKRESTWVKRANVLFIDNPVGTGFSYVDADSALTSNVKEIAQDLFVIFNKILEQIPALRRTPFYVFCESYGGKMTAAFGERLHHGIQNGEIEVNFQGVALGDSWISPIDSVQTWGPYLYQFNLLDELDLAKVNRSAENTNRAVKNGQWSLATRYWGETENLIDAVTDYVNLYNVLQHHGAPFPAFKLGANDKLGALIQRHVGVYYEETFREFMNNEVRRKLGVIPDHVSWGSQAEKVFRAQGGDFMKPVIDTVSNLIRYGYKVAVFQGQLDVICDTPGAERWINKLSWKDLPKFRSSKRIPLYVRGKGRRGSTQGFLKKYDNFSLYYIMMAGHMVPADNPEMALKMVEMITGQHEE